MPAALAEFAPPASSEQPTSSMAARGTSRDILRRIGDPATNLALWQRPLPAEAASFCTRLATRPSALDLDVSATPGPALIARLAATALFTAAASSAPAHWLLEDIAELASDFATLADCREVRVRLTKVADDGCAAFHVDTLPLRLLCTYAGRGTQWADEPDVRRAELGLRGRTLDEANAAIVPDPARIRTMPTGAVAILKGRLWPGAEHRGLVHRSHPVCCGEHARLRLAIDAAGFDY